MAAPDRRVRGGRPVHSQHAAMAVHGGLGRSARGAGRPGPCALGERSACHGTVPELRCGRVQQHYGDPDDRFQSAGVAASAAGVPADGDAAVQAEPGRPPTFGEREMYEAIWHRHTNRDPFTAEPISESVREALGQAARLEFTTLRMLSSTDAATVLDLAAMASA